MAYGVARVDLAQIRKRETTMLVGGVIDHEINNYANATLLGSVRELDEIAKRAMARINTVVIGNIVSVVATGG
jgi:ACT domain-containing protein